MKTLPDLSHFTGSENFYRHPLNRSILYTDGVQYLADSVGCHWLLDEIVLFRSRTEQFQVWRLDVTGSSATLTLEDGDHNVIQSKRIEFTDFPEPGITLWLVDNTILLPSEY